MYVEDWMKKDLITVGRQESLQECIRRMKKHSIRHLPVVEDGKLVGFITAGDVRQVYIASIIEDLTINDVMIRDPITTTPTTEIGDAAKIIHYNKIGGLPVVDDDDRLVGIITVGDIMAAFIELMGIFKSSSRVNVILGEDPQAFKHVSEIIANEGGEIISVGMSGHRIRKYRVYFIRLKKCNVKRIAGAIEEAGFEVISTA